MNDDELISSALNQPASDACRPVDLHLDRQAGLTIQWADGRTSRYPLGYLRKRCPCATCREQRDQAHQRPAGRSLTVLPAGIDKAAVFAGARLVGNYAIGITWADGHSTGIYDFRYLRAIDPDRNPETAPGSTSPTPPAQAAE